MRFLRVIVPLIALLAIVGCDKQNDSEPQSKPMAITYSMLDGAWQLTAWNGEPLTEDTFCYVEFDRKEQRFAFYDNLATMYVRLATGSFAIEKDDYDRYILSGMYDYGLGDWNDDYEVVAYAPGDKMLWRRADGYEELCFERIDLIPDEVVSNAREM